MVIKTTETEIEPGLNARSTYYGIVTGFPFDDPKSKYAKLKHHHYRIDIISNGKVETFDYYDSYSAYEKWIPTYLKFPDHLTEEQDTKLYAMRNPPTLSEHSLISAVGSIFEDAISGSMDLCDFVDEYGFDNCKQSIKTWKACRDAYDRLIRMGSFSENDFYRIVEMIQEKEMEW